MINHNVVVLASAKIVAIGLSFFHSFSFPRDLRPGMIFLLRFLFTSSWEWEEERAGGGGKGWKTGGGL